MRVRHIKENKVFDTMDEECSPGFICVRTYNDYLKANKMPSSLTDFYCEEPLSDFEILEE